MIYIISILILLLDQLTKYVIMNNLQPGQSIPVITNIFHITYIKNTGAAFGILGNYTFLLIIASIVILVLFFLFVKTYSFDNLWFKAASAFIIGGAAGNLIDRVRLGFVIDFLDFRIWPVFNIADMAIVTGGIILIIFYLIKY